MPGTHMYSSRSTINWSRLGNFVFNYTCWVPVSHYIFKQWFLLSYYISNFPFSFCCLWFFSPSFHHVVTIIIISLLRPSTNVFSDSQIQFNGFNEIMSKYIGILKTFHGYNQHACNIGRLYTMMCYISLLSWNLDVWWPEIVLELDHRHIQNC